VLLPDDDGLALLLEELPGTPLPEVELASLRGEELLELLPVLEPLPVLDPLAPAPVVLDSRTSETVTSGAPWLAGKVTMATPSPFCTPLLDEPPRPDEVEEEPLRPDEPEDDPEDEPLRPDDELPEVPERSLDDDEPLRPLPEVLERSADDVPDDELPVPAVLLRSLLDDDEEPMPPLLDDEPERPLLDEPLASERRLPLPRLLPLLLPLELPEEFTGQLLSSAGFCTSPWTIWMLLNCSAIAV